MIQGRTRLGGDEPLPPGHGLREEQYPVVGRSGFGRTTWQEAVLVPPMFDSLFSPIWVMEPRVVNGVAEEPTDVQVSPESTHFLVRQAAACHLWPERTQIPRSLDPQGSSQPPQS